MLILIVYQKTPLLYGPKDHSPSLSLKTPINFIPRYQTTFPLFLFLSFIPFSYVLSLSIRLSIGFTFPSTPLPQHRLISTPPLPTPKKTTHTLISVHAGHHTGHSTFLHPRLDESTTSKTPLHDASAPPPCTPRAPSRACSRLARLDPANRPDSRWSTDTSTRP